MADRVVERAGQGGDAAAQGHRAAAGGELGADEVVDVLVGEALQPHGAESRQEVAAVEGGVLPAIAVHASFAVYYFRSSVRRAARVLTALPR